MRKTLLMAHLLISAMCSFGQTLNISTGLGNLNTNEPNWKVGTNIPATNTPYIIDPASYSQSWQPHPIAVTNAKWIAPSSNWGQGQTNYYYERPFVVVAGKKTLKYQFKIAADDILKSIELIRPSSAVMNIPFVSTGDDRFFLKEISDSISCPEPGNWRLRIKVFCHDLAGANWPTGLLVSGFVSFTDKTILPGDGGCCMPRIKGRSLICDEEVPVTYDLYGGNTQNVNWILPPGVTGTVNPATKQLTITSWGPITDNPTVRILKLVMNCDCDEFVSTFPISITLKRNPTVNGSITTNGALVGTISISGNMGPIGTVSMMYIEKWDHINSISYGKKLRGVHWGLTDPATGNATATAVTAGQPTGFTWQGQGNSPLNGPVPSNTVDYDLNTTPSVSWKDLPVNTFYLLVHGQYFSSDLCGWKAATRVVYASGQMLKLGSKAPSNLIDLGVPNTKEYKDNLSELLNVLKGTKTELK